MTDDALGRQLTTGELRHGRADTALRKPLRPRYPHGSAASSLGIRVAVDDPGGHCPPLPLPRAGHFAIPNPFDMSSRSRRSWLTFLQPFAAEVARPVEAGAGEVDYVPTQVFTEYLRRQLFDVDGEEVRGIRYRSAARPGGISWVLFIDPSGCSEQGKDADANRHTWVRLDLSSIRGVQPWASAETSS